MAIVLAAAVAIARIQFHGKELATSICDMLNRHMRGRMEIGSIEWPMSALPKVATGGWVPVTLRNVQIFDDGEPRKRLVNSALVTAEIDLHSLMLGRHDFVIRNAVVHGGWILIEEVPEPYPLHAYDRTAVSLISAFYPVRKPGYGAGLFATTAPVWDLRDFTILDVDIDLHFAPYREGDHKGHHVTLSVQDVDAKIDDVNAGLGDRNFLYMDPSDPLVPKFYFRLSAHGKKTTISIFDTSDTPTYQIELDDLVIDRLAQVPQRWPADPVANTLEISARGHTVEGGNIKIAGELIDYWDRPYDGQWSITATGTNLGKTIARIDPMFSGEKLDAHLILRGPYISPPKIEFTLTGLDADVDLRDGQPPLELSLDRLRGSIDLVNDQGTLDETIAHGAGGEVSLSASFGLSPYRANANIDVTKPIDLGPWLPDTVRTRIGRHLSGRFHGMGDTSDKFQIDDIDLALGAARIDGGAITAETNFSKVYFDSVRIQLGQTRARIEGAIDTTRGELDVSALGIDAPDLGVWLRRFGVPAVAQTGTGRVRVNGSLTSPTAAADLHLGGVPAAGHLDVKSRYRDDVLSVDTISTGGFGGRVSGHGRLRVSSRWVERFDIDAAAVEVGKLPGAAGIAHGTFDANLALRGPLDQHLGVTGIATAGELDIAGETFTGVAMCVGRKDHAACRHPDFMLTPDDEDRCHGKDARCLIARADRAAGGRLDIAAIADQRGALTGAVQVGGLPLGSVARLAGSDLPAGGTTSAALRLGGTVKAPTAEGGLSILRGWIFGAFFGDATLDVAPAGPGRIRVHGSLLGGRLGIEVLVSTEAPYPVTIALDLRRVELDTFVDLAALLHRDPDTVRAWATGRLSLTTQLAPGEGTAPIDATVAFSELVAIFDETDAEGRPAPLTVKALSPVSIRWNGRTARLACVDPGAAPGTSTEIPCPVVLATPAGAVTIEGSASVAKLDLRARGVLDMAFAAPLLPDYFDDSGGTAELTASLTGSAAAPRVDGKLALSDVWFRPVRQETLVRVPQGTIGVSESNLSFTGVTVRVTDEYSGEQSELLIRGGVKLADFQPVRWAVQIEGEVGGKMLMAVSPQSFTRASGAAAVEIQLYGAGAQPRIDGNIRFDRKRPLALIPRGLRREIVLSEGEAWVADFFGSSGTHEPCDRTRTRADAGNGASTRRRYQIDLCSVGGTIDDEGRLRDIRGFLEIDDLALVGGDVWLSADALPFRIPRTLDLVVNAHKLHLFRDKKTHRWVVDGGIELVDGRYTRSFEFNEMLIQPASEPAAPSRPLWDEYPAIGAAELRLSLDVRKFTFDSNLGNIDFAGSLIASGTPRDPRFEGAIRVQRGAFKLPGSRARFTRTSGSLTFSMVYPFPDKAPTIEIRSEADYRDPSGQDHQITLTASGTLSQITWDLFTSSGFNKGQTLTLILSGRTPEQFRRSLGDEAIASDPGRIDPSTNPNKSYTEQLIKDVAGDFISLLVEDSLKDVSRLDVARIEVGTGSVGLHAEKKVVDNIKIVTDLEQTVRGSTLNLRGEGRIPWRLDARDGYLTFQSGYLRKSFDDAAERDLDDVEFKLVYRLIP